MAEGVRVCSVLFLCFFIQIFAGDVTKVTDLYCKDPDDGSYHRVNSTWSSTTFCGNYTCNIRRKNHTELPKKVTTQYNLIDMFETDQANAGSEHKPYIVMHSKRDDIDKQDVENDNTKHLDELLKTIGDKEDRYLNDAEIKIITKMLHTIKKSDLETIVEIYTLAKDILKEIDKDEVVNNEIAEQFHANCKSDANKLTMAEVPKLKGAFLYGAPADERVPMKNEASQFEPVTASSPKLREHIQKDDTMVPLSEKIPYYYPMSGFQRSHSYIHHRNWPQTTSPRIYPPMKKEMNSSNDFIPSAVPNPYHVHYTQPQKQLAPVSLVPYPFTSSYQSNIYQPVNPYYRHLQMYLNQQQQPLVQSVEIPKNLMSLIFGNIGIRTDDADASSEIKPDVDPLKEKLLSVVNQKSATETRPQWQTKELSEKVLNEVKANILSQKKLGFLPIKKMGRLEKVGKAIKIENLNRKKRRIAEKKVTPNNVEEDYEVYIEKITCPSFYEPGYFQIGDIKKTFPACCPRRLETTNIDLEPKILPIIESKSTATSSPPLIIRHTKSNEYRV